jgi:hypothetical protein
MLHVHVRTHLTIPLLTPRHQHPQVFFVRDNRGVGLWITGSILLHPPATEPLSQAKYVVSFMPHIHMFTLKYKDAGRMYSEFSLDVFQRSYTFINTLLYLHFKYAEGC